MIGLTLLEQYPLQLLSSFAAARHHGKTIAGRCREYHRFLRSSFLFFAALVV